MRAVILNALFLLLAFPAMAVETTIDEANRLKPFLKDILEHQKTVAEQDGSKFDAKGDVSVSPANGFYAAKFPSVRVTAPDKSRTEIGAIAVNIIPTSDPDVINVSASLPVPVRYYTPQGALHSELTLREQSLNGSYHLKMMQFVTLKGKYGDLRLNSPDGSAIFGVSALQANANLVKDANSLWTGPLQIVGTNIAGQLSGLNVKVGEAYLNSTTDRLDAGKYATSLAALHAAMKKGAAQPKGGPMPPDMITAAVNFMLDALVSTANGYGAQIGLRNAHASLELEAGKKIPLLALKKGDLSLDFTGFNANDVTAQARLTFDGQTTDAAAEMSYLPLPQPQSGDINLTVDSFPARDLAAALRILNETPATASEQSGQMAAMSVLMNMPMMLTKAGTVIRLKDSHLTGTGYVVEANGTLKADVASVFGVSGVVNIAVNGMESLLSYYTKKSAAIPGDKGLLKKRKMYEVLRAVGRPDPKNANGLHFRVEFVDTGAILVNDKSLTEIVSATDITR